MSKLKIVIAISICSLVSFVAGLCAAAKKADFDAALSSSLSLSEHVRMREAILRNDIPHAMEQIDVLMFGDLVQMDLRDTRPAKLRGDDAQRQRDRSIVMAKESWLAHSFASLDRESQTVANELMQELCAKSLRPCRAGSLLQ